MCLLTLIFFNNLPVFPHTCGSGFFVNVFFLFFFFIRSWQLGALDNFVILRPTGCCSSFSKAVYPNINVLCTSFFAAGACQQQVSAEKISRKRIVCRISSVMIHKALIPYHFQTPETSCNLSWIPAVSDNLSQIP